MNKRDTREINTQKKTSKASSMKRDQRYAFSLQQRAALSVTPFADKTISLTTDANTNLDNCQLDQNEDIDSF